MQLINQLLDGVEYLKSTNCTTVEAAKYVIEKYGLTQSVNNIRSRIGKLYVKKPKISEHEGLAAECEANGLPVENVSVYWYKGKSYSIMVKNDKDTQILDAVQDILADYKPLVKGFKLRASEAPVEKALKATLTDMHVGLDPNKKGSSLFSYTYNADIFQHHIDHVIGSLEKEYRTHGRFEVLFIDDLGDGLDGWNSKTTREGQTLDQNMGNAEQFKTYVDGKLTLIEKAIALNIADKIIIRSVTDCNHAGTFGEIANMTIQAILERVYKNGLLEFHILKRFMEHFTYGDHCHILTHGKDQESMKFGLPKDLTDKATNFINSYIDHYEIKSKYIHVEKGDLHTTSFNRTKKFDYRNFMSFAPPSAWVQKNFGDTYSGYSIQVIPKHSGNISHSDYLFEFDKAKQEYR